MPDLQQRILCNVAERFGSETKTRQFQFEIRNRIGTSRIVFKVDLSCETLRLETFWNGFLFGNNGNHIHVSIFILG